MGSAELREAFWRRHSNPKSGWSRVATLPALLYAVHERRPRLAAAVLAFVALNPLLFPPPDDDDAWMTRVVLAERWWTDERGEPVLGLSYPHVLNLLNVPVTGYALAAAARRRPRSTAVGCAASMLLKLWYVAALVRRYDAREDGSGTGDSEDDAV